MHLNQTTGASIFVDFIAHADIWQHAPGYTTTTHTKGCHQHDNVTATARIAATNSGHAGSQEFFLDTGERGGHSLKVVTISIPNFYRLFSVKYPLRQNIGGGG